MSTLTQFSTGRRLPTVRLVPKWIAENEKRPIKSRKSLANLAAEESEKAWHQLRPSWGSREHDPDYYRPLLARDFRDRSHLLNKVLDDRFCRVMKLETSVPLLSCRVLSACETSTYWVMGSLIVVCPIGEIWPSRVRLTVTVWGFGTHLLPQHQIFSRTIKSLTWFSNLVRLFSSPMCDISELSQRGIWISRPAKDRNQSSLSRPVKSKNVDKLRFRFIVTVPRSRFSFNCVDLGTKRGTIY